MQCECVAFPSKEYIFMKDKAPWSWSKSTLRYITERGVNVFDWPGYKNKKFRSFKSKENILKKEVGTYRGFSY